MVKRKSKINKKIIITLTIILLLAGLFFVLRDKLPFFDSKPNQIQSGDINYSPPTEEEKKETEEFKSTELPSKINNETQQSTTSTVVTPVITSWGQAQDSAVEVSGYIPGIYEDGGKCVLKLKKDGDTITQEQNSIKDAKTTICGVISIPRSKLMAGIWMISLGYSSANSNGESTQNITLDVK